MNQVPPSYANDVLNAIEQRLSLIQGLPPIKVRTQLAMAPNDPKYVVVIRLVDDEYGKVFGMLDASKRRTGEIKYIIEVAVIVQRANQYERPDPMLLYWRQSMRQRLDEPKYAGASSVFDTDIELGEVFNASASSENYLTSSFTVTVSSIEPLTGLNVSNQ
jgi:hypothetical protein